MVPLFDGHCDTLSRCLETGEDLLHNSGHLDLQRTGCYRPYAQFFAIFSNARKPGPPMWERFLAQKRLLDRTVEDHPDRIALCRTADEACQAARQGKAAAFVSVEGAELLDCDVDKLELAWKMGVRSVNLTWNHANALSGSHSDHPEHGLTPRGKAFVDAMCRLGILTDVSHLSPAGFWDVLERTGGPVWASHSNASSIFFHTRNLTDGQITAIIESRGVVGLNLYPPFLGASPDVDTVLAHLEHMLALGGEKTVALGGDWDGVDRLPRGMRDVTGWRALYEALLRRNYPESLISDLFYNNLMRIVRQVCSISVPET